MSKKIIGIIPARMESSRFPGKPLERICGIPMLEHVYHRAISCKLLSNVYVATCNQEISNYISSIGGNSIMTSNKHERASDRTAEALLKIEQKLGHEIDIVVMIQGDEPLITPDMISSGVKPIISNKAIRITNLMSKISQNLNG